MRSDWNIDSIVFAANASATALLVNVETDGKVAIQIDPIFLMAST